MRVSVIVFIFPFISCILAFSCSSVIPERESGDMVRSERMFYKNRALSLERQNHILEADKADLSKKIAELIKESGELSKKNIAAEENHRKEAALATKKYAELERTITDLKNSHSNEIIEINEDFIRREKILTVEVESLKTLNRNAELDYSENVKKLSENLSGYKEKTEQIIDSIRKENALLLEKIKKLENTSAAPVGISGFPSKRDYRGTGN